MKPNILHIGVMATGGKGFDRALKKVANNYLAISTNDGQVIDKAMAFDYDLCFLQIQNEMMLGYQTANLLKPIIEKPGFVINWTGDIRKDTPLWMANLSHYVDVTAFSNQRDVDYIRSNKQRAEFLQIGIDPEIFHPDGVQVTIYDDRDWETPPAV